MILYDQNFKFIGMSAETLAFLGYEDLDDFSSMHSDFADLFIKREGYIHKFENFSWIHYILYSGAANKKALIAKKNGGELSVEITIKEIFLNKLYDGLEKIYSVKLINENFTTISKSDVSDQRSAKKEHFSLQNLTKELNISHSEENTKQKEKEIKKSTLLPEPLLDIEKEFSKTEKESEPQITIPEHSGFILGAFNEESKEEVKQEEAPKSENSQKSFELNFDFLKDQKPIADEDNKNEHTPKIEAGFLEKNKQIENSILDLSNNDFKNQNQEQHIENEKTDNPDQEKNSPFSLELFSIKSEDAKDKVKELKTQIDDTNDDLSEDERKTKESLISQIKSDIKEIDEDIKPHKTQQEAATLQLQQLLKIDIDKKSDHENEQTKEIQTDITENSFSFDEKDYHDDTKEAQNKTQETKSSESVIDFLNKQTQSEEEVDKKYQIKNSQSSYEESSFEETLRNIFDSTHEIKNLQQVENSQQNEATDLTFTLINSHNNDDDKIVKNQQFINKEPIKSDDNIKSAPKFKAEVSLPPLGSLGLSKEEELDFIDEFLSDAASTVDLIEEYLKIDDFDNIKYSLIKIKSSAEILGFDAIIDIVKSLTKSCDEKDKDLIVKKLNELKNDTITYREHFATIAV